MGISISSYISSNICLVYFQPMLLICNYFASKMNDFFILKHLSLSQVFSALNSIMMLILEKEMATPPPPVFLPGEFHGQRSLGGYSPWGARVGHHLVTNLQPHDVNTTIPIF